MSDENTHGSKLRSRTAHIRNLAKHDEKTAVAALVDFLQETFEIDVSDLAINYDQYSLNSLNGFFNSQGNSYFFKFHQEEGEEDMKGEYYRADIIAKAKLPVDLPLMTSTLPGEQILVYRKRQDKRFSDVLIELDRHPNRIEEDRAIDAERTLNEAILKVAVKTLHPVTREQVAEEPIHHLFYDRLVDPKTGRSPGGRYRNFYVEQTFNLNGCSLSWQEFSAAALVLNGQMMASTFGEIFAAAHHNLNPENLAEAGGFVAHGDAHNANVWFETGSDTPTLSYFDPAFAGEHIPSLLAEVKATFHNIFAHPFWLYDAEEAALCYDADARYEHGILRIDTNWELSRIRQGLLNAKIESFWKPFLKHLNERSMLPPTWQETLRSAFAMCPALVMNLRAGSDRHNVISSTIAFLIVAMAGSKPETGSTVFSEFLAQIDPLRNDEDLVLARL
ncbi:MAG: hypothetical protein ABJN26_28185 [Stappiaceae bacterium]